MRRMRQHLELAALMQQFARGGQRVTHLLSQAYEQFGMRQVHEHNLLHFFVTQCDTGCQLPIEVALEYAPLAEEMDHGTVARVVRDGQHVPNVGINCATTRMRSTTYANFALLRQSKTSDKQQIVKYASTESVQLVLRTHR